MPRFIPTVLTVLFGLLAAPVAHAADETHLLIISVDGLRGDWAAHPDKNGLKIPALRKLAARGTVADGVRGVYPSVTYPSHTSLITGCNPARHNICGNGVFDPPNERQTDRWFWDYKDIRVPTLIDAARAAGRTTASVGWPVTVGAPCDVLFPEVWPAGNHDDAMVEMSRLSKPPELLAATLTKYDLPAGSDTDGTRLNIASYIVDRYKPRLMLVHFIDLDHAEHSHGPDSKEARAAMEIIDAQIGILLDRYEEANLLDKTLVAIVSDHGFLNVKNSFHVNTLLAQNGLIRASKTASAPAEDWIAAAWIAGGSAAIILKNPADETALKRVRAALAPHVGKPDSPIRRILERDEIARLGSNPRAALMLDPADGWTFSGRIDDKLVGRTIPGMHGQLPDRPGLESTFLAVGPGIAQHKMIEGMRMIDIAPTLAAVVGLRLPQAEGKVIALQTKGIQTP